MPAGGRFTNSIGGIGLNHQLLAYHGHHTRQNALIRLADNCNELLGVASVYGRQFTAREIAALIGADMQFVFTVLEPAVHAGIDHQTNIAYLQLIAFSLFVLLVAWFGGEQLVVRPIRSLVRTATRFGRGDLHVRATQEP